MNAEQKAVPETEKIPMVSVVMPVYNAENYLRESLGSLLGQTYTDFEIICVDDGSSDQSPAILREFAQKKQPFTILTQDHAYAGAARNLGIRHAKGKYLLFPTTVFCPRCWRRS